MTIAHMIKELSPGEEALKLCKNMCDCLEEDENENSVTYFFSDQSAIKVSADNKYTITE